jgi:Ran GTPase-activating protein (RanGAP) involved in mRNA processing and transport
MWTRQLANLLAHNTTVHNLDLRETILGAEGARHIARMLMTNTRLETLDLASNSIEDEGATAVAQALKSNPNLCLVKLELQRNGISSGTTSVPPSLPSLPSLSSLPKPQRERESYLRP